MTDSEAVLIATIHVAETRLLRAAAATAIMRKAIESHSRPLLAYGTLMLQEHMEVVEKALGDAADGIYAAGPTAASIPTPEGMVQ